MVVWRLKWYKRAAAVWLARDVARRKPTIDKLVLNKMIRSWLRWLKFQKQNDNTQFKCIVEGLYGVCKSRSQSPMDNA